MNKRPSNVVLKVAIGIAIILGIYILGKLAIGASRDEEFSPDEQARSLWFSVVVNWEKV